MCKIMAIAGIKPEKWELVSKFMVEAATALTKGPDKDGFGYARMNAVGALTGERWLDVADAFADRPVLSLEQQQFLASTNGAFFASAEPYNSFGDQDAFDPVCVLLHARYKTSGSGIVNTHPFVAENTAMVHNGVISNYKQLKMLTSDCDSEAILNEYLAAGVGSDATRVQVLADKLEGSYACAFAGTLDEGTPYMDILKGGHTGLCVAKIAELETVVFCTTFEILDATCKALNLTIEWSYWMRGGNLLRFNAVTGEVLQAVAFEVEPRPPYKHRGAVPLIPGRTPAFGTRASEDVFTEEELDAMYARNGWGSDIA